MESKIFIDVNSDGKPQIRIDYNWSGEKDDVRDKLLGRFLFNMNYGSPQPAMLNLRLVLGHHHEKGMVCFIEPPESSQDATPIKSDEKEVV